MDIHNLGIDEGVCGAKIVPGVAVTAFIACACDIETFPALPEYEVDSPEDYVTLPGDIVLKEGKYWKKFKVMTDKGFILDELIGDKGSQHWKNSLNFNIAGTAAATLSWHQVTTNGCLIVVVKEKSGNFRVIGNVDVPATYASNQISNGPDNSMSTSVLEAITGVVAPIYEGVLPTGPAPEPEGD
jgi:hypothetical protein